MHHALANATKILLWFGKNSAHLQPSNVTQEAMQTRTWNFRICLSTLNGKQDIKQKIYMHIHKLNNRRIMHNLFI